MQTTNHSQHAARHQQSGKGSVDIQSFNSYFPISQPTDVVIESPAGTNFWGVLVGDGSQLNVQDINLRINQSRPALRWKHRGVSVSDGSTLNANANLVISGSKGQGIFVTNNSHASLAGLALPGASRWVWSWPPVLSRSDRVESFDQISGNGTDLFCDSRSLITAQPHCQMPLACNAATCSLATPCPAVTVDALRENVYIAR